AAAAILSMTFVKCRSWLSAASVRQSDIASKAAFTAWRASSESPDAVMRSNLRGCTCDVLGMAASPLQSFCFRPLRSCLYFGFSEGPGAAPLTPPGSIVASLCDGALRRRFESSGRLRGFLGMSRLFHNTTPLMGARFHG